MTIQPTPEKAEAIATALVAYESARSTLINATVDAYGAEAVENATASLYSSFIAKPFNKSQSPTPNDYRRI